MEVLLWVDQNWFQLLQSICIVASLVFTAAALRLDVKTRRIANLIEITKHHREIWTEIYRLPGLARVSNATADLKQKPLTTEEELFISLLILHLNTSYHAMKDGVFVKPEGLREDIRQFFARPMAKTVWEKMKRLQDAEFVRFIEACLKN